MVIRTSVVDAPVSSRRNISDFVAGSGSAVTTGFVGDVGAIQDAEGVLAYLSDRAVCISGALLEGVMGRFTHAPAHFPQTVGRGASCPA